MVGDFFKSQKGEMAKWLKKASNLITWLRSETIITFASIAYRGWSHGSTCHMSYLDSLDGRLYGILTVA